MKKVIVIGCPGSGKSTFARALHERTGLPLYHLDMMYWNEDRTTVAKSVFRQRLQQALDADTWIIDGNYQSTIELRLQACDTVFFLDYPQDVCLDGALSRRGQKRTDIPWIEPIDDIDSEFLQFIQNYNTNNRPIVLDLLNQYCNKSIHIFKTRQEADHYLSLIP